MMALLEGVICARITSSFVKVFDAALTGVSEGSDANCDHRSGGSVTAVEF